MGIKLYSKEQRLFKEIREGERITNPILVIFMPIIVMFLSRFITVPIIRIAYRIYLMNNPGESINEFIGKIGGGFGGGLQLILSFGSTVLIYFLWVKFVERRSIVTMGFHLDGAFKKYIRGFLFGFLMIALSAIMLMLLGEVEVSKGDLIFNDISMVFGFLFMIIGWIIQGATEEIMMRGYALPVLGTKINIPVGVLISSSIFGFLHLLNSGISPLAIINLILFGVFAAFYAMYEDSLWGVCALHSSWNWAQGNVFGFLVSGGGNMGGSIFTFTNKTDTMVNGGAFGPEGGLVITIIYLIGIVILLLLQKKKVERVKATYLNKSY
ncbi:CAAX protease self-immunity family protein [Clostridium argentinense CDC 2741]|uniref:CAAX protease self-immunity family protein n=1 Tax=Clostridium argentinense CDC 2741 TaxID=1418104 RepID=A0A0C1QYH6_9CLOT|nr:type II CAAX endopeptidase family protein [Clostridium argentinense]ARC85859.1 CPBP family intramembrane metalloprotease domain-containing protein [Clostridium argentinense]KIE46087.1 CAAX protease self-immunity family protein [Clostridium argentinense CDC 2741]NFF39945.1 CPBP family intramembrane metalloprotease [Clostridium argentinense]NFP48576.1 CPBP family intramembrane metalloprotease [Clostridium argentinense]NFP71156.1 CPBP family intramembrane metalloprotease [Clostridium argentine